MVLWDFLWTLLSLPFDYMNFQNSIDAFFGLCDVLIDFLWTLRTFT
jgi:hypothetical protein